MAECDDALTGPGRAGPQGDHLCRDMDRVTFEQGGRKIDVGHAKIGNRRAQRCVVHGHANKASKREQRIHDGPPEFCLRRGMRINMQRLRVHR